MRNATSEFRLIGATSTFLRKVVKGLAPLRYLFIRSERLDEAALRDLGISRSEIRSFFAEANGTAQRTRRRVASDLRLLRP